MEIFSTLRDTPLPTILVVGGIALLLLSILTQVGGWVSVPPQRQKVAGIFGIVVLTLGIILYLVPASQPPGSEPKETGTSLSTPSLSSYFNGISKEGWGTTDGKVSNPGRGGSGGGVNNGYLKATPLGDGKTSYYVAPPQYYGDWRGYSVLKFDLWSSKGKYYVSGYGLDGDVYIANGHMSAQRSFSHRPPADWQKYVIPLQDDGQWSFGGGADSIDDILMNVTGFLVRAEYGVGEDFSGLDNVEFVER